MAIFAALVLAGTASASPLFKTSGSSESRGDVLKRELHGLSDHFQRLHAAEANAFNLGVGDDESTTRSRRSSKRLASLPAAAASVLKFDPSLFLRGADMEGEFAALLEAELTSRSAHPIPTTTFPYVLCGPQASASAARKVFTEIDGENYHEVRF